MTALTSLLLPAACASAALALAGALAALRRARALREVEAARVRAEAQLVQAQALLDARGEDLDRTRRDLEAAQRRLEAARAHVEAADRLATLGHLAVGAAHEISEPLSVALTNLAWLQEQLAESPRRGPARRGPGGDELTGALGEATAAAQRVTRIVRDLRDLAEERASAFGGADLVPVLRRVQRLLDHEVRARAQLRVELPDGPLLTSAAEPKLGQLFAGLVLFAARSVEEGRAESNELHVTARAEDQALVVDVRDTGRGLPPEALEHLFDPFHGDAVRPAGRPAPSLAVCLAQAKALGGDLTVESTEGRGTTYRVVLPQAGDEARLSLGEGRRVRPRVLLVDDEPLVCASLYRVLSRRVDLATHTSPRQALAAVRSGEPFDAVLCDLMMPEMSGVAFLQELWRLRPALAPKLVFLTGGAFTPAAREALHRLPNARLQKPCTAAELMAVLAQQGVLPGPSSPPAGGERQGPAGPGRPQGDAGRDASAGPGDRLPTT